MAAVGARPGAEAFEEIGAGDGLEAAGSGGTETALELGLPVTGEPAVEAEAVVNFPRAVSKFGEEGIP